jgi:chromosome segregation ATPase
MWIVLATLLGATPAPANESGGIDIVVVISIVVGAVFGTGGIVAFFTARSQNNKLSAEALKLRAETEVLPIDLAKGAVVVQADVIKDLRTQIESQDKRLEVQHKEIERERRFAQAAADKAKTEHEKLQNQCGALEEKFRDLLARFEAVLTENGTLRTALLEAEEDHEPPAS